MKSRTSFFNRTVLKKDITRFAPVWAIYVLFLLVDFLTGSRNGEKEILAASLADMMRTMSVVNLIYGGVCANILFGDLFQSRMCNALHTMPIRREGWFASHVCAGLLFSFVPNVVATVFQMVLLGEYFYMAPLWLVVVTGQFLFFFGLGIFAVMCAGNRLGMAAVYALINGFSAMVFAVAKGVYEPLMYGIELLSDPFTFFCPVFWMSKERFIRFDYDFIDGAFTNGRIREFYPEMWWYLAAVAVIGAVFAGLALLLYRKRRLERAGDFLAIRALEPVFIVVCSVAGGVFLYAMSEAFGFTVDYFLMGLGVVAGFFGSQMLIKRTVRVFKPRQLLGLAVLAVVIAGSLVLTRIDPAGITRYVPETEDISYMRVYRDNDGGIYTSVNPDCYQLEDPAQIDTFRQVHGQLLQERHEKTDGASHLYIAYQLKNGRQVKRYYTIDENTAAYDTLRTYFSDWRYIFSANSWEEVKQSFTSLDISLSDSAFTFQVAAEQGLGSEDVEAITLSSWEITDPAMMDAFLEALRKDCEAGNMAQSHTFHVGEDPAAWCYLGSNVRGEGGQIIANGNIFRDVTVYSSAEHTTQLLLQWLRERE